jgi:membrane protease YdiL (CAAX protease family)
MPWDFWLILLFLGVAVPWRGHVRLRKLLARPAIDTTEKLTLYAATIAFQWLMLGVVAWRALARGLTPAELGLVGQLSVKIIVAGLLGAGIIGGLQWLNLRRMGKMEGAAPDLMRKLSNRILPQSLVELLPYLALAVTAGVCEEFLYRGFTMAALSRVGLPIWVVVLVTSALFGLAHAYQGRAGVLGTGVLGVLLAIARIVYSSLAPVMIWHTAVDVVAGIAGPKYLRTGPNIEQVDQNQAVEDQ